MTDSRAPWTSPGAGGATAAEPAPTVAEELAVDPTRRAPSWTPPPKRGLVPLRPLSFGVILSAPFRLQRRAPRTTLAPALVVSLVTTATAAVVQWALVAGPRAALDASYYTDFVVAGNLLNVVGAVSWFVPLVLALAATALLAGPVVVAASRSLVAERVSWRGLRWRLRGRLGRLIAWTALVLAFGAGLLVLGSLLPLLVTASSSIGFGFAVLLGFLEIVGLLVGIGYLIGRLGFTSAAIALEGLGVGAAMARSWRLTKRSGWRVYGAQLLVWIIVGLSTWLLTLPVGWALEIVVGLVFPHGGDAATGDLIRAGITVVVTVVTALTGAFGLVVQSVTGALLYLDQRMRVEGLDLALARYVDERQRGATIADPFPGGGAA